MKNKMVRQRHKKPWLQFGGALIALALIATGTFPLLGGELSYKNWWGGLVFAPITIIAGLLLLYVIVFKWEKFKKMK
jgi:hypothetical protein